MTVKLEKVTPDNVWAVISLDVSPEQKKFVAPNAVSLAQAQFNDKAWFRAIYADDEPVGFVMLEEEPEGDRPEYFLWRLMVAETHQGRGYARRAMELVIEHVKERPLAFQLGVSCVPGPGSPQGFYLRLGFEPTGKMHGDEVELVLTWAEAPSTRPDITLRPLNEENLRAVIELKVADSQKDQVISNLDSIAEAMVHPHMKLWAIYLGDDPAGFAMLEEDSCKNTCFLWRLMIAEEYQGKGYGKQAMEAILEYMRRRTGAIELKTSCLPGKEGPEGFYRSLGFEADGDLVDDEVVLIRKL